MSCYNKERNGDDVIDLKLTPEQIDHLSATVRDDGIQKAIQAALSAAIGCQVCNELFTPKRMGTLYCV